MIYNNPKIMKEHWIKINKYEDLNLDEIGEFILLFNQKKNHIQPIMSGDIHVFRDEIRDGNVYYYQNIHLPNKFTDVLLL